MTFTLAHNKEPEMLTLLKAPNQRYCIMYLVSAGFKVCEGTTLTIVPLLLRVAELEHQRLRE